MMCSHYYVLDPIMGYKASTKPYELLESEGKKIGFTSSALFFFICNLPFFPMLCFLFRGDFDLDALYDGEEKGCEQHWSKFNE
jgi:hypothetical protein